jgi:hypothetical protein
VTALISQRLVATRSTVPLHADLCAGCPDTCELGGSRACIGRLQAAVAGPRVSEQRRYWDLFPRCWLVSQSLHWWPGSGQQRWPRPEDCVA